MIKSWKHKGLRKYYEKGTTAGIVAPHANQARPVVKRIRFSKLPE
ncbi:hypothetical protein MEG1DRAFT_02498 [Photorhabdus temperata subsp. temperata Meg1]|uniref:Uncharacterized protein n=1 Tax=Photorhabdus temperata subsp. temperata Meg1 TaxID=1393735 RepID=A0A081RVR6_PHOTE|nr:hypothetical protein MEG1DRAFT_02498 [Photorhabdus temperata subsp. temperata Meg1]